MENQTNTTDAAAQMLQLIMNTWTSRNTAVTNFFNKYDNDSYLNAIAPGRNRAIYLFGHLINTNDALLPLLGIGQRLYPEMDAVFSANPDNVNTEMPSITELKNRWEKVNTTLSEHFNKMTVQEWLGRHTAVSEEDFAKEPQRNKLNVLLGRTNHQSYHFGQLNLLPVKELVA